ncbi:hypothetical protein ACFSQ7_13210 [Paenibacillus rhizoplanae]
MGIRTGCMHYLVERHLSLFPGKNGRAFFSTDLTDSGRQWGYVDTSAVSPYADAIWAAKKPIMEKD